MDLLPNACPSCGAKGAPIVKRAHSGWSWTEERHYDCGLVLHQHSNDKKYDVISKCRFIQLTLEESI